MPSTISMYMLSATCIQLPCRNALVSSRHGCPVSVYGAKFAPQSSSSGFDRSPYDAARHISTNIAILTTASTIVSHGLDVGCSLMGSWYGLSRVSRARAIIFGVPDTAGRVTEREQKDARCRQRARIPVKEVSHELRAQHKRWRRPRTTKRFR
ncbi:hypothetical protein BVIET440_10525 [Burkholderia vietnamiensis]